MTDKIEEIREKFERLTSHIALVSEEMRRQSDRADKAWAEVDKLRAERERLREALREIARLGTLVAHDLQGRVEAGKVMAVQRMADEAHAALDASRGNTEEDYD